MTLECGAAPIGQTIPSLAAGNALRHAIRIGEGQQNADLVDAGIGWGTQSELPLPLIRRPSDAITARAVDRRPGEVFLAAVERLRAQPQVGVTPTRAAMHNVPLTEQRGEVTGQGAESQRYGGDHHVGESRVHRDMRQPASMRGQRTLCIKCAELPEQLSCLRQRPGRRRIEPRQFGGVDHAPFRQIQRERCQVCLEYFRRPPWQ